MKIPLPKPVTTSAILPNRSGKSTQHIYLETRECDVDGPAFEFIFKCLETGQERRWGVVDRVDFSEAN